MQLFLRYIVTVKGKKQVWVGGVCDGFIETKHGKKNPEIHENCLP